MTSKMLCTFFNYLWSYLVWQIVPKKQSTLKLFSTFNCQSTYWRKLYIYCRRMLQNDETDRALPGRQRTARPWVHWHFPETMKSFFYPSFRLSYTYISLLTWTIILLSLEIRSNLDYVFVAFAIALRFVVVVVDDTDIVSGSADKGRSGRASTQNEGIQGCHSHWNARQLVVWFNYFFKNWGFYKWVRIH